MPFIPSVTPEAFGKGNATIANHITSQALAYKNGKRKETEMSVAITSDTPC